MARAVLKHGPPFRRSILLLMVFGMPVFFLWGITAEPFNVPKLALLTISVSLAAAVRLLEVASGAQRQRMTSLLWPALFISLPLIASWLASPYKKWALLGHYGRFEGLLPYLLLASAGLLLVDAFSDRRLQLAWAWSASAGVISLYALLQAAGIDPWNQPIDLYVTSTVGHGNFLAGVLATALPVTVTIWVRSYPGARIGALLTILISTTLIVSLSQGGWAAAVAGVAVTAGLLTGGRFRWGPTVGIATAIVTSGIVLFSVLYALVAPGSALVGGTARARAHWWIAAAEMGADAPLLGHGPNVYALKSSRYRTPVDALAHGDLLSDGPHSVPMSMFANAGVAGALGFTFVFIWVIRTASRNVRDDPLRVAFLGAAVAYFVQSLVSFDELLLGFAMWVGLAGLAVAPSVDEVDHPPKARGLLVSIPLLLAAVIVAITGLAGAALLIAADADARTGRIAFARGDFEKGRRYLDLALAKWDQPMYRIHKADGLGTLALQRGPEGRPLLAEIRRILQPIDRLSYSPAVLEEAISLHLWSVHDLDVERTALRHLERAIRLDPYNPNTRVRAAEASLHLERPDEAANTLRSIVPILEEHPAYKTYTPPVWAVLAVAESRRRDDAQATIYLTRALEDAAAVGGDFNCHVLLAQAALTEEPPESLEEATRARCAQVSREALRGR